MAAGVTMTGYKEFARGVEQLPRTVTLALRSVAQRAAGRVYTSAQTRLRTQLHGQGVFITGLRIVERSEMQAFIVDVGSVIGRPDNLALWIERGTVKMSARPFLRPSLEEHSAAYITESDAAVEKAVAESMT